MTVRSSGACREALRPSHCSRTSHACHAPPSHPPSRADYVIIRRNFDNGRIKAFGADQRWHSDDKGRYSTCACKPWTLTSDSLVVHHPHPELVTAWHENRTRFALLGQPYRPYGYNVCAPDGREDPSCNWVQQCRGAPPAPEDCIVKS